MSYYDVCTNLAGPEGTGKSKVITRAIVTLFDQIGCPEKLRRGLSDNGRRGEYHPWKHDTLALSS
jgi:hypothetical protein